MIHKPFSQQELTERVLAAIAEQRTGAPPALALG
jgi:hypothetical protein